MNSLTMNVPLTQTQTMKAVVCTRYGSPDYLVVKDVAKPTPKDNEVLIRVYATPVTTADTMMRRAKPFISRFFLGFTKPKKSSVGTGFAGVIEEVGTSVAQFNVGDQVLGETGVNFGANAEYIAVSEEGVIALKPANMSFEEAATFTDGHLTSINFLKNIANIQPGQRVLINGASGSLGTSAIQLAKYLGAEVTGVCSAKNVELVKSLGANNVIDYTKEDFTQSDKTYDVIYDTVGISTFGKSKKVLSPNGQYISPVLSLALIFQMLGSSLFGKKKAKFSATGLLPAPELKILLKALTGIFEEGKLRSIIDRKYSLDDAAKAHAYVDKGHKIGNVVITVLPKTNKK